MPETISRWRLIGSTTGLSAVAAYGLLIAVPLPNRLAAVIARISGRWSDARASPCTGCSLGNERPSPDYWPQSQTSRRGP